MAYYIKRKKIFYDTYEIIDGVKHYFICDIDITDTLNPKNGLPIRSQFPQELKDRLLTERQWLVRGYKPKFEAYVYEINASKADYKVEYFMDIDVEPYTESTVKRTCYTCKFYKIRSGKPPFCTYFNAVKPIPFILGCKNWVCRSPEK